jgi:hypothetical protein
MQGLQGELYLYAKFVLRVGPYFHILALFKSYPRVTVIWIDVHPVEENPTNTPHASHTQSVYGRRLYVSHTVNP